MAYLKENDGLPANSIKFSTNRFPYEIDFVKMKQKNLDPIYRTEREIRRRPVFSRLQLKLSFICLKSYSKPISSYKNW